jgi:hypothetical protein
VQGFITHRQTKAPPMIITTAHGMGSGSALRLSGMTKRGGGSMIFEPSDRA